MSMVSPACLLSAFSGLCRAVGMESGETGITGRKQAPRPSKYLVLEGERGNRDELKKDQEIQRDKNMRVEG